MTTTISQIQIMRLLPFERADSTLRIESKPCSRCNGTGDFGFGQPCLDCGRLGRLFAGRGRDLLKVIAAMLDIATPIDPDRSTRWNRMAMHLSAKEVRQGMKVARTTEPREKKVVSSIETLGSSFRFTFDDLTALSVTADTLFSREISDFEADRANVFLAQMLGKGAVEVAP